MLSAHCRFSRRVLNADCRMLVFRSSRLRFRGFKRFLPRNEEPKRQSDTDHPGNGHECGKMRQLRELTEVEFRHERRQTRVSARQREKHKRIDRTKAAIVLNLNFASRNKH